MMDKVKIKGKAYSGNVIDYYGKMIIDLALTKVRARTPVLWSHEDEDDLIGVCDNTISEGIDIDGFLYDDDSTKDILEKLRDGAPYGLSVGLYNCWYRGGASGEKINGIEVDESVTVCYGGELREVSVCSIGADPDAGIVLASGERTGKPVKLSLPMADVLNLSASTDATDDEGDYAGCTEAHADTTEASKDTVTIESEFVNKINKLMAENAELKAKAEKTEMELLLSSCGKTLNESQQRFARSLQLSMVKQYIATLPADTKQVPLKQNLSVKESAHTELKLPKGVHFSS